MKTSWKFYPVKMEKDKFRGNFDLSQIVFQNNHNSYRVCRGRNRPPFYSYEKLTQILSVTILVKHGPDLHATTFQGHAENFGSLKSFNPFPNKPWFLPVCSTSLLKTLRKKEKLLVTSNFSFSHSVFYPSKNFRRFYQI